jgi:hypothetical protein
MVTRLTTYDTLLLKYKPRPIRDDREHRRALKHVDELIDNSGRHARPSTKPTGTTRKSRLSLRPASERLVGRVRKFPKTIGFNQWSVWS